MAADEKQVQARRVHASTRAAELVTRMVDDLELWNGKLNAAMFLAAHAVDQGLEPVAAKEMEGHVLMGNLQSLQQGVQDAGDLVLFQLAAADGRGLDEVLVDDLKGLIEAGARDLEDTFHGRGASGRLAERLTS